MERRPKRRKHRDNPYILKNFSDNNIFEVSFKDGKGIYHDVKIDKSIYQELDKFELRDLSELNEYDNHIEHSEIYEENLYKRAYNKPISLEEFVETKIVNDKLKEAINHLSEIQKRRIINYYFYDMTQREIAEKEGTSIRAVQYTLNSALKELYENLKNLKNWLRKSAF